MPARIKISLAVLFIVSTAALFWWSRPTSEPGAVTQAESPATPTSDDEKPRRTIEHAWRWDEFPARERRVALDAAQGQPASLFSVAGIHNALRTIELDVNGLPVIDSRALHALQSSFANLTTELSEGQLRELEQIIKAGLPGPAGEQAAQIVTNYYRYDVALRAMNADAAPPADLASMQRHQEQLVSLRQQIFGNDIATKLFAEEQAHARFTLESMRIQETPGLTPSQKEAMQASLREQLDPGVLPDKPDARELEWQERYARFEQQKQLVLNAGLPEREAEQQIEQLINTHFSEAERERARNYIPANGG